MHRGSRGGLMTAGIDDDPVVVVVVGRRKPCRFGRVGDPASVVVVGLLRSYIRNKNTAMAISQP